ncbi:MAG: UDP-N-acetylglucosamine 2-epimerase [Minwuia sp.]|uniref:UDP-N-acetylglucosamine 2-epimerase n=1 Tax=Minwuia sp. TaxID=2493630 RepID=UPI003A8A49D7
MLAGGPVVANTGDVMLDALQHFRSIARDRSSLLERLDLTPGGYAALTIHRAENTADAAALERVLAPVAELAESLPVIFPVHPRTRQLLESGGARFASLPGLRLCDPLPYLDFIELEANAKAILTDSGGVQKEAFFLSVPCLTLRRETEWVETVEAGWNKVVGQQPVDLAAELDEFLDRAPAKSDAFGRGDAGLRIARLTETLFA